MCQKIAYATKADAAADAKYMTNQRRFFNKKLGKVRKAGRKLRPYSCRFCGSWHLTTQKQK